MSPLAKPEGLTTQKMFVHLPKLRKFYANFTQITRNLRKIRKIYANYAKFTQNTQNLRKLRKFYAKIRHNRSNNLIKINTFFMLDYYFMKFQSLVLIILAICAQQTTLLTVCVMIVFKNGRQT